MTEGSCAYSAISLSAGGQDEQPWLVNSSITARGSPCAHCTDSNPTAGERKRGRDPETNHHDLHTLRCPAKPDIQPRCHTDVKHHPPLTSR